MMFVFGLIQTIVIYFGLVLLAFMIFYFKQKPLACQSSFDSVCIINICFAIIIHFWANITYLSGLILAPLPTNQAEIFYLLLYWFTLLFFASSLVTLVIKYFFVFHINLAQEISDKNIVTTHLFLTFVISAVAICFDFVKRWKSTDFMFTLLTSNPTAQR